jgi:hypothetical protein
MQRSMRILATVAVAAVAGAVAVPSAAFAGPVTFVGHHADGENGGYKFIEGFDGGSYVGTVDLWRLPGSSQTNVRVCDWSSDGRSVFGRVLAGDGRTFEYQAPAANAVGNMGEQGCNQWVKGFSITNFRLRVAGAVSGAIEAP